MSGSETGTSVLRALDAKSPKSTSSVASELRQSHRAVSLSVSQVFDILVKAEANGKVKRVKTSEYDELKPVSTISWLLTGLIEESLPDKQVSLEKPYVDEAMIVVSQPIFLSTRGVDLRKLGMPVLEVREAMEKVVMDAKGELRIACPYYDELFIDVLSSHAHSVANLSSVAVLAENMDPILLKATSLFQNVRIRTLYRGADAGGGLKVQGIHAKLMIADRSEVLIGSFNFRFSHINYNVDLGLLAKGRIADHYATIYDSIWGSGK